jgi:hypothetical protein
MGQFRRSILHGDHCHTTNNRERGKGLKQREEYAAQREASPMPFVSTNEEKRRKDVGPRKE